MVFGAVPSFREEEIVKIKLKFQCVVYKAYRPHIPACMSTRSLIKSRESWASYDPRFLARAMLSGELMASLEAVCKHWRVNSVSLANNNNNIQNL